ncbi:MAG: sll0787 family AIR synthase-like protein [Sinimarinibacterium flocculans]|uniref:sll0787 family AIR synthase-like protein n=1 Tax=Sinimarinibacterium flocculans TaxID=985250 RepID=UPI003C5CFAB3
MNLQALITALHASRGLAAKRDIAGVMRTLELGAHAPVPVGDDCAAIPDGDGWQLLAIEGFIQTFVERDPWFAGWCGVMVNVSDIYAMGGRPIAVVDAIWGRSDEALQPLLAGIAAAARAYGVPVVGGHSNARSRGEQLAVSILGRATALLSSFDAQPGDVLIVAIDLRGRYREPFPHWNCTDGAPPERLRGDLELLPRIAGDGLCKAAKDISQAGLIGTLMMLLECSGVGATLEIDAVPRPADSDPQRWLLSAFPSYGFILAVPPRHADAVLERFRGRDIACATVGRCDDTQQLRLARDGQHAPAWDFRRDSVIGCAPDPVRIAEVAHA